MIYSNDLFEVFSIGQMGKISLLRKMVIWIKLSQIYALLYLMIHSKDICEMLSVIIGYNWKINATFKFTKKLFEGNLSI